MRQTRGWALGFEGSSDPNVKLGISSGQIHDI